MARARSEMLSWMGIAFEVVKAIVDEVLNLGGSDEDVRKILKDGDIRKQIAQLLMKSKSAIEQTLKVLVDCTKSLAEMVQAGQFDWVNEDITQDHFPIQGKGQQEVEVALFHFNKVMTSDQVIVEMQKAGFRPATIEELLALGATHKELQKQFPIVAIGSVWRRSGGRRCVPYLDWSDSKRRLRLVWFEDDWYEYDRFAALRNAS